jgi:curli biogenesis system outer membrane secretion channel CsgG
MGRSFAMSFTRWVSLLTFVFIVGCTASVDKSSVKATEGAPVSAQVKVNDIPYDSSLPKYVVTVAPMEVGVSSSAGAALPKRPGYYYGWGPFGWGWWPQSNPAPSAYVQTSSGMSQKVGKALSSQLLTGLSHAGNIVIIDYAYYLRHKKRPRAMLQKGEIGPFVIKGTVTEFNEVAEANERRKGGSLGWLGTVMGIVGGVAGVPGVGYAGAGVAAANPTYENTEARRTGSVGMDLQLVNPRNGRLVGSLQAAGKFSSVSQTSGLSVFGVGGGESAFAASALGQATRAAVNEAVRKIGRKLADRYPIWR